jgi:hypothetical protein
MAEDATGAGPLPAADLGVDAGGGQGGLRRLGFGKAVGDQDAALAGIGPRLAAAAPSRPRRIAGPRRPLRIGRAFGQPDPRQKLRPVSRS